MTNILYSTNNTNCNTGANCGNSNPFGVNCNNRRNRNKVRDELKDWVLLNLGAPVIDIELDNQQVDMAIETAFQQFEDYAPREYFQYYLFQTTPGQSVYTLPPDVGHVRSVYYREAGNLQLNGSDLGGVIPIEYFNPSAVGGGLGLNPVQPVYGRMGEWVQYKQYEQLYNRVSSQIGGWEWVGGYENIKLYPVPCGACTVIVHYLQRCFDFKTAEYVLKEGALAYALRGLGRIRSKIQNPPGPNGGIQLDGQSMLQEGIQAIKDWEERLITRYGDILPITLG